MSQDLLVRMMTALGHLVFILACVSFAHSALIVPFWQPLPEVQRQRQHREKVAEPEQPEEDDYPEEDLENTMIASGPLCVWRFGHSSCIKSGARELFGKR